MFSNIDSGSQSQPSPVYYMARYTSDLANPLFIPPLVFAVVGYFRKITPGEMGWVVAMAILFYTIIPLVATYTMYKTGQIESMDLPKRETRGALFISSVISASIGSTCLGLYFYFNHPILTMIAIVFFLNPLVGYLFNLKWKVSMHAASIASAGAIFFALFYLNSEYFISDAGTFSLLFLLILLPMMVWSRYRLSVHSIGELLAGTTIGFTLTLLELLIMIRIW